MSGSRVVSEKFILDNFENALEKDHIKTYFQPMVRTLTGKICCAETLARWVDPEIGMIPPDAFIGILEEHRLIHKLDLKMAENICKGYALLALQGYEPLPFSLNMSRLDFEENDIFEQLTTVFKKYNVPTNAVRLEITESVAIENTEWFREIFDRFHNAGFDIWMDDFGSGYTSLNVLKDYEFDLLKIDMKFLSSIDPRSKKLIAIVVSAAKSFGVHILAEGVETAEQVAFLKEIGCEILQGYYFARPMSADDLKKYIREGKRPVEKLKERRYMNAAGLLNPLSSDPFNEYRGDAPGRASHCEAEIGSQFPLALLELADDRFIFKYMNKAYINEMKKMGLYDIEAMKKLVNDRTKPYFHDTKKQMELTAQIEGVMHKDYVIGDICYSFSTKFIAKTADKLMVAVTMHVFGSDGIDNRYEDINNYSPTLFYNFELVNIMHPDTDSAKQIYSNIGFKKVYGTVSLRKGILEFAEEIVHSDDRQRYLDFMDFKTMRERILQDGCSFVQQPFRIKSPDGSYIWRLVRITHIPTVAGLCYMYSMQKMPPVDINVIESKIKEDPDMFKRK